MIRGIDLGLALFLVVLGCAHNFIAAPLAYDHFSIEALWFVSAGMALWYAGFINLLRVAAGRPGRLLAAGCLLTNISLLAFALTYAAVLGSWDTPATIALIAAVAALTIRSATSRLYIKWPRAPHAEIPASPVEPDYPARIAADPLNPALHLQNAVAASIGGKPFLAYAELKTAGFLGAAREQVESHQGSFTSALPDLRRISHNQYFRFMSLAAEINSRRGATPVAVLDIGGGQGELAAFIPDASYCLAEPRVNGISGESLPFPDHSFDYVVSCHVLEHIARHGRRAFLDQLLSKSRIGVILLNPFIVEGTHVTERLQLLLDVTGAPWAKEHLDCGLPHVSEVQDYAAERDLEFSIRPNGTLTTSLAMAFIEYFASRAGLADDWMKVNTFFNEKYMGILDSPEYPTAYLIYLGRRGSGAGA